MLGGATAASWFAWGNGGGVLAALSAWPPGLPVLYGLTIAAMAAFGLKNVLGWLKERQERQALTGAALAPS